MSTELFVLWGIAGWCGTPPRPRPGPRPPYPDPWPWLEVAIIKTIGLIGAFVGGVLFTQTFAVAMPVSAMSAAATAIGAYFGAVLFSDVYGFIQTPIRSSNLSMER